MSGYDLKALGDLINGLKLPFSVISKSNFDVGCVGETTPYLIGMIGRDKSSQEPECI